MRRDLTVEELLLAQRRTVMGSATTADTTIAAGAPGKTVRATTAAASIATCL